MLDMKSFKDWARDTKGGKSSEEEKTAKNTRARLHMAKISGN
jgi:hypothetical protein